MSSARARPARLGPLAVVAALVALVAGYLGDCFAGLGFAPAPGGQVDEARDKVQEKVKQTAEAIARPVVVVQGERCRLGDTPLRECEAVCGEQASGAEVEIDATQGTHRAVEALRECLKGRGVKVKVHSE
jgi:hypothetical protein